MRIFHLKWPRMKHEENSLRGIKYAASHGYDAVDIDMQITKDGVIVGTHWARPMIRDGFKDPRKLIRPSKPVSSLTWAQVSRLVAGRWYRRYKISRIERLLVACERRGLIAYLEPKGDPRFATDAPWEHIAKAADQIGAHVKVRALPQNADALKYAARAGFPTRRIR